MAGSFTSNWAWGDVNKTLDVNIDDVGARTTRNNWVLNRFRYSDEINATQLKEEQASVSAYAAGTLITEVTAPTNFATFIEWPGGPVPNFGVTGNKLWQTAYTKLGFPIYKLGDEFTNQPDPTKITILRQMTEGSPTTWWWEWGEWDASSFPVNWQNNGMVPTNRAETTHTASFGGAPYPLNSNNVSNSVNGTFSGKGASQDEGLPTVVDFYCSNDVLSYTNGVDWHRQTQTWIYKDEYV